MKKLEAEVFEHRLEEIFITNDRQNFGHVTNLDELLPLVLERLPLAVHDRFQLLEVPQLDLQLLHLSLDEQRDQTLDLPFLDGGQVLGLHGCRGQGGGSGRLEEQDTKLCRFEKQAPSF